ncbi:Dimethyladenosine transferase [Conglomerata obtusa]
MGNPLFKKRLGQHILTSQSTINAIITRSKIKNTDTILEIGPGTGALTIPILQKCKKIICIEKDPRLASELLKKVQSLNLSHKIELIIGDALKIPFPHFDMCISNTPYQISSPLVFKLLKHRHRCSVLMFQKEFADRMVARPGMKEYCRLSVAVQMRAKVEHLIKVSRKCFVPMPDVESAVVRIEVMRDSGICADEFGNMLRICFLRKNKTLGAIFKGEGIKNLMRKYIENDNLHKINGDLTYDTNHKLENVVLTNDCKQINTNKLNNNNYILLMDETKQISNHLKSSGFEEGSDIEMEDISMNGNNLDNLEYKKDINHNNDKIIYTEMNGNIQNFNNTIENKQNILDMSKKNEGKKIKKNKLDNVVNDELIKKILIRSNQLTSRANKMDIEDFLTLFLEFKKEGIHFEKIKE